VVVLENEIRPDTIGRTEPIKAKYELLPRGHYTYEVPSELENIALAGPKLSMNDYQQVLELYQAQNAMQIAEAAGAAQYAGDTYRKAAGLLNQAQVAHTRSAGMTMVVTLARQAAETAEDARVLAVQRKQQEELGQARERAAAAEQSRARAEAALLTAESEAAATRALLEQERTARRQTEAATAPAPPPPQRPAVETRQPAVNLQQKAELRMRLFRELSAAMPARDTPRGLLMTFSGADFQAGHPRASIYQRLAAVAETIGAHPGLMVTVEGHGPFSEERAFAVRDILAHDGAASSTITARGLGDARPLTSNATAAGREQNRRVEIIVSGDPIGQRPNWAKAYSLIPNRP
jgi:outer membrane protein OmpA-like peptidoglycan-associated protein